MTDLWKNQLHFSDNLDLLRDHVPSDSVNLVAKLKLDLAVGALGYLAKAFS